MTTTAQDASGKSYSRELGTPLSWEERQESAIRNLRETLQCAGKIEETIKARLDDPTLSSKEKAGLGKILRTAHMIQRTLKKVDR